MIKTIDVECNAANPNLPLKPMFAFVNSPSSIRVRNVPKRIGDWCIRKVYFTAVYPDSTVKTAECVLTGGVWVGTIEGTNTSGTSTNGYTIFADGTDENGNNVTGYVLGKGDIEILEADGTLSPDPARYTVKLLSAEATQPREGDMYPTDDGYVIWQDGEAHLLGTPFEQITAYVDSAISSKADLSAIPSNTSQLSNDSGFITSADMPNIDKLQDINSNIINADRTVSYILDGQAKWILQHDDSIYEMTGTKTDSTYTNEEETMQYGLLFLTDVWELAYREKRDGNWIDLWLDYTDGTEDDTEVNFVNHDCLVNWQAPQIELSDKLALESEIPTKTSDLTNDSGFVTSEEVKPLYVFDTSTGTSKPTEMACYSVILAGMYKANNRVDKYAEVQPLVEFDPVELTPNFTLRALYLGYHPWKLSKFFDQTYSPELELVWWSGQICRVVAGRFVQSYNGCMWRTKGIGFAIPCDENGIPDGRLYEITQIEQTSPYRIGYNNPTQVHTITGNENWSAILTIDEQENQITCTRSIVQRVIENKQTFPTLDDIPTSTSQLTNDSGFITSADVPTKTSDLTNDSGFITSADIITKRDLNDFNVYVDPMADMTTTKFTVVVSYAFDPSTPIFTAELTHRGGQDSRWLYSPSGSNQSTIIDYFSNTDSYHLSYLNLQDGGGNEHSGSMNLPLTSPYWTCEAQDDWFHFSVTSQTTTIATKEYVDSLIAQLSALEARIAALEGN